MALVFKGSHFPWCLSAVLESEKWNVTIHILKRNRALWSEPRFRNPKGKWHVSVYNAKCRIVSSKRDLITLQTHYLSHQ